jgi:hypothetical protein
MSFHVLAIGDSVMWGQGILPQDKFCTKVTQHVGELLGSPAELHNYAHSGATIVRHPNDDLSLWGEIPVQYPSLTAQWERARAELGGVIGGSPCLVLVTCGINDVKVDNIITVDPTIPDKPAWVRKLTNWYIQPRMTELLVEILGTFERAYVVVTGYYRVVTPASLMFPIELQRTFLPFIPPAFQVFYSPHGFVDQWSAFHEAATEGLMAAVAAANGHLAGQGKAGRVFFADPGFGSQNGIFNPESFFWRGVDDPLHETRLHTYLSDVLNLPSETPIASTGHPNLAGVRAYTEAIKAQIELFKSTLLADIEVFGYMGGVPRVVYRGVDGHIHEIGIAGDHWAHFDLTEGVGAGVL